MFVFIWFILLIIWIIYYYRYTIYSTYIIHKVWSLGVVQEYTQWDYEAMEIVWAERAGFNQKTVIWLHWQINNTTKQIAIQYYCKIVCTIYSVWIYDFNKRHIVYWEEKNIDWIKN